MNMPFGKWRGTPIDLVPEDYLRWLYGLPDLREPLRAAVETEIDNRMWARRMRDAFEARAAMGGTLRVPRDVDGAVAVEIVRRGYRALSLEAHPDRGGTTEMMQRVNAAATWLRDVVGRALPVGTGR